MPKTAEISLAVGSKQDQAFFSGQAFIRNSHSPHLHSYFFLNTTGHLPSRASGKQRIPLDTHDFLRLSAFQIRVNPTDAWSLYVGKPFRSQLFQERRVTPFWEARSALRLMPHFNISISLGITDFGEQAFQSGPPITAWYQKLGLSHQGHNVSFQLFYQGLQSPEKSLSRWFWGAEFDTPRQPLWELDTDYQLIHLKALYDRNSYKISLSIHHNIKYKRATAAGFAFSHHFQNWKNTAYLRLSHCQSLPAVLGAGDFLPGESHTGVKTRWRIFQAPDTEVSLNLNFAHRFLKTRLDDSCLPLHDITQQQQTFSTYITTLWRAL